MQVKTLTPADLDNVLSRMDAAEIDELPFGAIQLDKSGKILTYNSAEADITGRNPAAVIGKDFFKDVAPCTARPAFQGVFQQGVLNGRLDTLFDYTFDYNMKPTQVRVHMKKALVGDTFWIIVRRI